ncbi:hypothetical protein AQUCO_01300920v1 [Aquilegia coerulea]|uniref:RBR-type E3 ubiquitin transferase n=1 Tax=Aquilegia coerulea TaxID=218851 RepID=A0A2G5E456_AQUCA|nr:hypothetical protein AQUCO_01300920v1 [Aquilegia coerulea]
MGNTLQKEKQPGKKSEEHKHDEEDGSTFTCEVCVEPLSHQKRFRNRKRCSHRSYCLDCIAYYIEVKIEEYNFSDIKCPGLDCDELLDPLICRSILPVKVFERWCDVLCEKTILPFQRAYCPYSECSALILNECGGKIMKTKCPNCKKFLCLKCGIPWHYGYKCNETEQLRDQNDFLLCELMKEKKWRRCPVCNHCVELISGCQFVKCRCGATFCHGCGRKRTTEWCWCKRNIPEILKFVASSAVIFILLYCFGGSAALYIKNQK